MRKNLWSSHWRLIAFEGKRHLAHMPFRPFRQETFIGDRKTRMQKAP
ncbi:hypothetical protein B4135_2318 [Caldibacillus debilis]|uniref:Uncharacterized protein n=1 Tax=Caldibacillus debilis TaxID=301148 RepID=A0A150M287_9BACI|nr:hypothetical protein B4135_2318 [Caldibacillus debilis]